MPLYEVLIERTIQATIWVDAPDKTQALTAARELSDAFTESEWEESFQPDIAVMSRKALPDWVYEVWVGGEDGQWVHGDEYEASA